MRRSRESNVSWGNSQIHYHLIGFHLEHELSYRERGHAEGGGEVERAAQIRQGLVYHVRELGLTSS